MTDNGSNLLPLTDSPTSDRPTRRRGWICKTCLDTDGTVSDQAINVPVSTLYGSGRGMRLVCQHCHQAGRITAVTCKSWMHFDS